MGLLNTTRELASLYAARTKRRLQGTPQTKVDAGNRHNQYSFQGQDVDLDDLREVKEIRESGGVISHLVHAKALMQSGTGVEIQTENDDLREWIVEDAFPNLDNLLIEITEDALWFPYSVGELVETRGGGFSHLELIEPWTMLPRENEYGEVIAWEQHLQSTKGADDTFEPDEITSFVLNKSSGRDNTGISEVLRARDEIEAYKENEQAIRRGIYRFGSPKLEVKVGREGAGVIDDNELRRIRSRFESDHDIEVMGRDVETNRVDPADFAFDKVTEHDLRKLALALGLPLELANVGSDGLGSGMPAELRKTLFERQARAAQRSLSTQFESEVLRPVIEDYSPYPVDDFDGLRFGDPIADEEESSLMDRAEYMKTNEVRERMDLEPVDDPEVGDSFRSPANVEAPEEESPTGDDGFGGLFSDGEGRDLMDPMINGHDLDPETGEGVCESTGEVIEAETMGDLTEDCPHCSEPLSAFSDDVELSGGTGNRSLSDGPVPEWDAHYLRIFEERIWSDEGGDKALVAFNESEVPEMVLERLREAVLGGSVFSDIESIPSSELMEFQTLLADNLGSEGWSLRDLQGELQDRFGLDEHRAEMVARSETQAAVNQAREDAYMERGEEDARFDWIGPSDHRTTEACEWIKSQIPDEGVALDELKALIQEAPKHDPDVSTEPREYSPHVSCRHTFVRRA